MTDPRRNHPTHDPRSDEDLAEDLLSLLRDERDDAEDAPADLSAKTIRKVQASLTARDLIDLTTIVFVLRFCAPLLDLIAAFFGGAPRNKEEHEGSSSDE